MEFSGFGNYELNYGGVHSTTASSSGTVLMNSGPIDGRVIFENHPHHHTTFVLGHNSGPPPHLTDVSHHEFTPLEGLMLGGAVMCPAVWYTLRRRARELSTQLSTPPHLT
ncbi:MAG: hypothetical protein ACRELC_02480 [Gemmatimonadota bacterium]